jgi:hypothetical protein
MSTNIVDALSRHAAQSTTRRGSILTLGGALTAAVAPSLAQAKKADKKAKKAKKRRAQQRATERAENEANQVCANQVPACKAEILAVCGLSGGRCLLAAECCSSLGVCNATELISCVVEVITAGL